MWRREHLSCFSTCSILLPLLLRSRPDSPCCIVSVPFAGEDLLQLLVRETEMRRRAEQAAEEANNEKASTEQLRAMQARQVATLNGTVAELHKQLQQYQCDGGDVVSGGFSAGGKSRSGLLQWDCVRVLVWFGICLLRASGRPQRINVPWQGSN